jgi:hypothetical protein
LSAQLLLPAATRNKAVLFERRPLFSVVSREPGRDEFADEFVARWVTGQVKAGFKQSQEEGRWFGKLFALTRGLRVKLVAGVVSCDGRRTNAPS